SDKSKPLNYLLHGVIVHSGDLHGGNYYVLLKPEKNGRWFKFDDFRVTPVTDKEVLEDNYGGEVPNSTRRNVEKVTNAYILVYIRESDIDSVLSPVLTKDTPEHLQRRIDKEMTLYEQKKKEAEERHLYLSTKHYHWFDLANFDDQQYALSEFPQIMVLKSDTYRAFKAIVAHKFGTSPEKIRFWVLVNRQNKTIRSDVPIPNDYLDMEMEEIRKKMVPRHNDLKLFLEVADKSINGKAWFPPKEKNSYILVFIKYFNPDTQSLEGVCHLYVRKFGKVGDIIPILCKKKNFPPRTPLNIYE
ncbi:26989_t:CDS:2, partial [Racocetra persica]